MKNCLLLLFFSICFAQAQTPADKKTVLLDYRIDFAKPPKVYKYPVVVFLKDYETKQPITQANVTLEGYLLKDIKAKYNKKEGYFYFKKIPRGYNTIMANAENYNPKGLQNTEKLPQEITLELHDPMNIVYNFQKTYYSDNDNSYEKEDNYRHSIFVEDPYKIIIDYPNKLKYGLKEVKSELKDSMYCKRLDSLAETLGLEKITDLRLATMDQDYNDFFGSKKLTLGIKRDTTYRVLNEHDGSYYDKLMYWYKNQANIYKRKDNKPFKRFNCPILKAIRESKYFDASPVIYVKVYYSSNKVYNKKDFSFLNPNYESEIEKASYIWFRTDIDPRDIESLIKNRDDFKNNINKQDVKYISNRIRMFEFNLPYFKEKTPIDLSSSFYKYDGLSCGLGMLDTFEQNIKIYKLDTEEKLNENYFENGLFNMIQRRLY